MKKYLFIALAALGFAACAEKLDDNNAPHGGEMEESYIAINLLSADVDTSVQALSPRALASDKVPCTQCLMPGSRRSINA